MKRFFSFDQIKQAAHHTGDYAKMDADTDNYLLSQDLEIVARFQLKRLARDARSIEGDSGKGSPQAKAAWRHFFEIRDSWIESGQLGSTELDNGQLIRLGQRGIRRFNSLAPALRAARKAVAGVKTIVRNGDDPKYWEVEHAPGQTPSCSVYMHPHFFEYWIYPAGVTPKNTAGWICTFQWHPQRILCHSPKNVDRIHEDLVEARKIPFTVTFTTDRTNADAYGEMVIRAFTQEGAELLFREAGSDIPGLEMIDCAPNDGSDVDASTTSGYDGDGLIPMLLSRKVDSGASYDGGYADDYTDYALEAVAAQMQECFQVS